MDWFLLKGFIYDYNDDCIIDYTDFLLLYVFKLSVYDYSVYKCSFLEMLKNILKGLFLAKVHLNFLKEILKNIMICDFMANDFGNTSSYYRDIMEFKLSYYCTIPIK